MLVPASPELRASPHSPCVLSRRCGHHTRNRPPGSGEPVGWRGAARSLFQDLLSPRPLPYVHEAAAGVCVLEISLPTAQPWAGGGGGGQSRVGLPPLTRNFRSHGQPWARSTPDPPGSPDLGLSPKLELLCPILAKFLRGEGGGVGRGGYSAAPHRIQDVAVWGWGAGRRQPEGKARRAGAGGWELTMALGNVRQMVPWN